MLNQNTIFSLRTFPAGSGSHFSPSPTVFIPQMKLFYLFKRFFLVNLKNFLSRLVQTCPYQLKLVQFGSNLSKFVQICQNFKIGQNKTKHLSKYVQICPNFLKLVKINYYMSKFVQTCPNWFKLVQSCANVILQDVLSFQVNSQ